LTLRFVTSYFGFSFFLKKSNISAEENFLD
jgi:hypothetical protein